MCAHVIGLLVWTSRAAAQTAVPSTAAQTKGEGAEAPGTHAPTLVDPYRLNVAGGGRRLGMTCFSAVGLRTGQALRAVGYALRFKAMLLGGNTRLSLGTEARLRYDTVACFPRR